MKTESDHVTLFPVNQKTIRVGDFWASFKWSDPEILTALDLLPPTWENSISSENGDAVVFPKKFEPIVHKLTAYFKDGIPIGIPDWDLLDKSQWSDFQQQVYEAVVRIPHGETRTYLWVAQRVAQKAQKPAACRAVGQALKKNPFPLIIPCHRVVSAQGLGGFMGKTEPGTPEIFLKTKLLDLEHNYLNPLFPFLMGSLVAS